MNFYSKLEKSWAKSGSLACVGLDPLISKMPTHLQENRNSIFEFNKAIIDATADIVCAFKPQIAYFSSQKAENALEETIAYIHENYPDVPVILDAKRSDMDSTAEQYAIEAFDRYKADALTVVPFQGTDAIKPYLDRKDKGIILLCKTSNPGSSDLQDLRVDGEPLFRLIARRAANDWNTNNNVALVVGATQPNDLREVRKLIGKMPVLVPGIGAQGGNLESTVLYGTNQNNTGLIISASRSVIYASTGEDFAEKARMVVLKTNEEINAFRK
jgi:orotidine-5'-phosphate decarboxylase